MLGGLERAESSPQIPVLINREFRPQRPNYLVEVLVRCPVELLTIRKRSFELVLEPAPQQGGIVQPLDDGLGGKRPRDDRVAEPIRGDRVLEPTRLPHQE